MRLKQRISNDSSGPSDTVPAPQKVADGDEVAERLRHLLAFDLQKAVVHPEIRHYRRMEGAARLRDLVFEMGEDEVDAAAVDIKNFAEIFPRHRRAFDVPAGTAGHSDAGRRRPGRLARLRRFPQHE